MQPSISSERLILRPFKLEDAGAVQRLAGDVRVSASTTAIPHPYPDGAAEAWIRSHAEAFASRKEITFASTLRSTGELIGAFTLLALSQEHSRGELGYWVGVPYWGLGYCSEAVGALLPFARQFLGLTRISGRCFASNPASARVLEKAGLQLEGRLVKHMKKGTVYEDILMYGITFEGRA